MKGIMLVQEIAFCNWAKFVINIFELNIFIYKKLMVALLFFKLKFINIEEGSYSNR